MTKYLQPGPFSGPTSNGRMSDVDYAIAVGALVKCEKCGSYVAPEYLTKHDCPGKAPF